MFRHSLHVYNLNHTHTHLLVFNSQGSVTSGCSSRLKDFSLNACLLPGDIKSCKNSISTKANNVDNLVVCINTYYTCTNVCYLLGYSTCSIFKE